MTFFNKYRTIFSYNFININIVIILGLLSLLSIEKVFAASAVAITVNGNAITTADIEHRIALLQLQHRSGDLKAIAKKELIDEMLKRIEAYRLNMVATDNMIEKAYENFCAQNHMPKSQFDEILNQTNITPQHFKDYLRAQIEWMNVLTSRYRAENSGTSGMLSLQDTMDRIIKNGGKKPSVKEYKLRQLILVIPQKKRGQITERRMKEAKKIGEKLRNCADLKNLTRGMIDVTIRDLGRILEPQLPPEWHDNIIQTKENRLSKPMKTARGVEAICVSQIRSISDDRAAQLVFSIENNKKNGMKNLEALNNKYIKELHDAARIKYLR